MVVEAQDIAVGGCGQLGAMSLPLSEGESLISLLQLGMVGGDKGDGRLSTDHSRLLSFWGVSPSIANNSWKSLYQPS